MTAVTLLFTLTLAGFEVTARAGQLFVSPGSNLTDAQKKSIADAKPALLAILAETDEEWNARATAAAERAWRNDPFKGVK